MSNLSPLIYGLTLGLLAGSFGVQAQTVYKLQTADGRTVYSDKVLPRTKVQKEITDNEGSLSVIAPPASVSGRGAQVAEDQVTARLSQRDQLWRELNLAQANLDAARRAKVDGEEPLPGERIGTAAGRSRLNETYWARQDLLERAIDSAQRRLERAEQNLRAAGS